MTTAQDNVDNFDYAAAASQDYEIAVLAVEAAVGAYVGDTVAYLPFGATAPRTVTVTAVYADIKNGRPGFDGVIAAGPYAGQDVWGYADQIV